MTHEQPTDPPTETTGQHGVDEERRAQEIRSEVTLIHGFNQLLRRRVRNGRAYSADELLRHADTIDQATVRLATLLEIIPASQGDED